jgi:hypothetical protein
VVCLPTAFPPLGEVRPFATQRGVVAVARMHDRVVVEAAKILLSRSFISDAKSSRLLVLPGPPGNRRGQGTAGIR